MAEPVTLVVNAIDVDGDPLTYSWSDDCPSAQFSTPTSSTTLWSSSISQVCQISIQALSRGLVDAASLTLVVYTDGTEQGAASIATSFIPNPVISYLYVRDTGGNTLCTIHRSDPDASCRVPLARGQPYSLRLAVEYGTTGGARTQSLSDSCGGTTAYDKTTGTGTMQYVYLNASAPATEAVCRLTAQVTNEGLSDSFPLAVLVK